MAPIPILTGSGAVADSQHTQSTHIASLIRRTASSLPSLPDFSSLITRQNTIAIPASYSGLVGGPAPGTVAGIVLGSVGGFILILWLIYSLTGYNRAVGSVSSESVVVRERRKSTRASSSRRHSHSETVEVRGAPSRPVVERVVMQERVVRPEPVRSEISEEDEVVVIEEHSPPRRSKSKRDSGYRTVDPLAYGGGDRPLREVRKSSGSRR